MGNSPSSKKLQSFYNDLDSYTWTKKSLGGSLEPYDYARLIAVKKLINKLDLENKKVLDVGCGSGIFTELAYSNGAEAVGIDISKEAIKKLNKRKDNKNLYYKFGSAESIPFKKNTFNMAMCLETLEHLKNPSNALEEIRRILKNDGLLIVSVPNWFNYDRLSTFPLVSSLVSKARKKMLSRKGQEFYSHLHFHSPSGWEKKFSKAGYKTIYSRPVYIFPPTLELKGVLGVPKFIERYILKNKAVISLQQKVESKIAGFWPFSDLGQSHLWLLKKDN